MHHYVETWIASILPLLQLLVASFRLKKFFLFCRRHLSHSCPFDSVIEVIQETIPLWKLSTHDFLSIKFGASISGCRSCLYLFSTPLLIDFLFSPPPDPTSTLPWLSPMFNTPSFILFTTTSLSFITQSLSVCPSLTRPRVYGFTKENDSTPFAIYDSTYSVPEPDFSSSTGPLVDGLVFRFPLTFLLHMFVPHTRLKS